MRFKNHKKSSRFSSKSPSMICSLASELSSEISTNGITVKSNTQNLSRKLKSFNHKRKTKLNSKEKFEDFVEKTQAIRNYSGKYYSKMNERNDFDKNKMKNSKISNNSTKLSSEVEYILESEDNEDIDSSEEYEQTLRNNDNSCIKVKQNHGNSKQQENKSKNYTHKYTKNPIIATQMIKFTDEFNNLKYFKIFREDDLPFTHTLDLPEIKWMDMDNDVLTEEDIIENGIKKQNKWIEEEFEKIKNKKNYLIKNCGVLEMMKFVVKENKRKNCGKIK